MKLGWILTAGPPRLRDEALARLDVIADAYLSVSTPVMTAAPSLLALRHGIQEQIRVRCVENLAVARRYFPGIGEGSVMTEHRMRSGGALLLPEGGWSAMLALPPDTDEDALALRLLDERGVLVHPGSLFDIPRGKHLVLSLLSRPTEFETGLRALLASLENPM
jgi:aspartate/methionine/tyrosine aminotransferase